MTTTEFEIIDDVEPSTIRRLTRRVFSGRGISYLFLTLSIAPIVLGYSWLVIASFSTRTRGLIPVNAIDGFGGLTLSNWSFLSDIVVWKAMWNSLLIAVAMVIGVGVVSTSAGYALARMKFLGRKGFLSMTLILHAFKAEDCFTG